MQDSGTGDFLLECTLTSDSHGVIYLTNLNIKALTYICYEKGSEVQGIVKKGVSPRRRYWAGAAA